MTAGMGIAVGDYDLDGDDDLYFSSSGEMVLLQNQIAQGSHSFSEVTDTAGVNVEAVGWGTVFADFDNDGWEDLYLATADSADGRTNRMYRNTGLTGFQDVSDSCGASNAGYSIGVAYADYDNDGRLDLVGGNFNDAYYLYRNITADAGNWLSVKLTGAGHVNRDAVGALALLDLSNGLQLRRRVHIGSSIGADHQRRLHFGLGDATPVNLTVHWPDGVSQIIANPPINEFVSLVHPAQSDGLYRSGFEE
jgi:hypothetical protein